MCKKLDDDELEDPLIVKNDPNQYVPNIKGISLKQFQLEQRIDDIEKHLIGPQEFMPEFIESPRLNREEDKEKDQTINSPLNHEKKNRGENIGLSKVSLRFDALLNDINARISDLEFDIKKISPDNMHSLIRDIAEIVIQKETRQVVEDVDGLKGNFQRDFELVDSLKKRLKELDERFSIDIDKKVEIKDLKLAKNQLRRRVKKL